MKTNLSAIDTSKFVVRPDTFAGKPVYLVFPKHNGVAWEKDELIYRSSVWSAEGELLSAGFKKFFNYGEREDLISSPTSLKNTVATEKIDGSLLICSYVYGQVMVRTRGTIDATRMENGAEVNPLINKYWRLRVYLEQTYPDISLLFEWVTPTNRIVLDYPEPDMYLVGAVRHSDYSYYTQKELDAVAELCHLKRPAYHNFSNNKNLLATVEKWINKEGVCLYFNNGQDIKKIKSDDYLMKHALKAELSLAGILKYFVETGCRNYEEFLRNFTQNNLVPDYDYESLIMANGYISRVIDAHEEYQKIYNHMVSAIDKMRGKPRKEIAEWIFSSYGKTLKTSLAFTILDNKTPDKKFMKDILTQLLRD